MKRHAEKVYIPAQQPQLTDNAMVAIAIVSDPHSETGEKIQITRSLRNDPLAGMLSRGQIDEAKFNAGRKFQFLHECSTIGVIRAIDPAKESVDGGRMPEFLTYRQIKAFKELREAYEELGQFLSALIFDVLALGHSLTQAAQKRGARTEYEIKLIGAYFRGSLEKLAILWGFAGCI